MNDDGAELIVSWYTELEDRFSHLLRTVPVSKATEDVFLPPLSSIILETCSLIDTIFRDAYQPVANAARANMLAFARFYEPRLLLSSKRSVLFQHPVRLICPFDGWISPTTEDYQPLEWWQNHNSLKHDRINNYERSTFRTALNSLAALHQVISLSGTFVNALLRRDMICFGDWGVDYVVSVLKGNHDADDLTVLIESELFGTPVGAWNFPASLEEVKSYHVSYGRKFWRFIGSMY